ncbi:UbiH/UbiF family hydroxylase [Ferruginivarius sediminum]|uniref:UbiH/UbiF family hydroxylase n=2 Tax=Ferruginivarius sediminum TaxID=2661937 RepID=A0A369TBX5_9PROT|nr:UbiH/UbiF family hydroxylase [Ferruginivarius sediminum]
MAAWAAETVDGAMAECSNLGIPRVRADRPHTMAKARRRRKPSTLEKAALSRHCPGVMLMRNTEHHCDILVVGGGVAGLAAAVVMADLGFEVACVDAMPPEPTKAPALDGRTTALLQGAVRALSACGVWADCETESAPLNVMRIIDENGRRANAPLTTVFDSADVGEGPFGFNVPNAVLRQALMRRLRELANAHHIAPAKLSEIRYESTSVRATLEDGRVLTAALSIGADGKGSPCREAAGIRARRWTYGQTAMAFSVAHTRPHGNTSTEFHRPNGPLVLVPLPGNRSSVVWVERERGAAAFMNLDEDAFLRALAARTRNVLGDLTKVGPRFSYPVGSLLADRYAAHRLALVGESAHALPPIGAQGLNLGITDVTTLAEVLTDAWRQGCDIGAEEVLRSYERRRRPDVVARVIAVDALNRAVMTRFPPVQAARHLGLSLLDRFTPLKTALMRQGMVPVGEMPKMMRGEAIRPVRRLAQPSGTTGIS